MLIQHDLKCLGPVVANFHVLPIFVFSYLDLTASNLLFKLQLESNTDGWIDVLSARKATSLLMSCVYCVWSLEPGALEARIVNNPGMYVCNM